MSESRPARGFRSLRIAAALVIGAGAIYLAVRQVDPGRLFPAIRTARFEWLLAGLFFAALSHVFQALRWEQLLSAAPAGVPFSRLLRYLLAGQLANLFAPARAGDLGRAWVLGRQGAGGAFAIGTVVLEKVLDSILFAALAGAMLLSLPLPPGVALSPAALLSLAAGLVALLWAVVRYWDGIMVLVRRALLRVPSSLGGRAAGGLEAAGGALQAFRRSRRLLVMALLTVLLWAARGFINFAVLRAFDLDVPPAAALVLVVVLQLGISANLVPGALGVFEYLGVLTLAGYGVAPEPALAFAVVLHAVMLLPMAAGGLWAALAAARPSPPSSS